jgi:undecaprenyl-phosphate 4-deoxy-4-formamido-L-arabinose transferase
MHDEVCVMNVPDSDLAVSVVVPVYQGEKTLRALIDEIAPFTTTSVTPAGRRFRVVEVVLVHDGARDHSADVMADLSLRSPFVRPIWLSRNFGQHAATFAGMASTVGEWVVTLDEDGQQDPRDIASMLDVALDRGTMLVYAEPRNPPPHGLLRNCASALAKWIFVRVLGNENLGRFNSLRLVRGEIARGVAAYCGPNVYLDVALAWVVGESAHCPVLLRTERGRPSGYNLRLLLTHFWQLVLTSGTRPLRFIAFTGIGSIVLGAGVSAMVLWQRIQHKIPVQGWTSMIVVLCFIAGAVLLSLGIIAEYLGIAVSMAMGKPPYFIMTGRREEPARR